MTGTQSGTGPSKPVLRDETLAVGSILTVVAVVAALAIALVVAARKPTTDESALRAVPADAPAAAAEVALAPSGAPTPNAEPSAAPTTIPATAAPIPPPTPPPTATPAPQIVPTATPLPTPAPLPTSTSNEAIVRLGPGRVTIPVASGLTLELSEPHDSLHLPGLSAFFIDGIENGEVDIFTPVATTSGQPLGTFADVVRYLDTDPLFAGLDPTFFGFPERVDGVSYEGRAVNTQTTIGFYTHPPYIGNGVNGWYMPAELQLVVLDLVGGPVIVTGEAIIGDSLTLGRARDVMSDVVRSIEVP